MPYTTNSNMPRIRREAAHLVHLGWSTRKVARHFGFSQSVIVKWFKKSKVYGYHPIPTKSSRPKHHPKELSENVMKKIVAIRLKTKRTSGVVHQTLLNDGIKVSLNSVRRTIDRHGLMKKRSHLKRWHPPVERPQPLQPGDLVQLDTIHRMINKRKRLYVFVLLDVYSRWVYVKAYEKMSAMRSMQFVREAQHSSPFCFKMLQSDHGPEFGAFTARHTFNRINQKLNTVSRTCRCCLDPRLFEFHQIV